MGKRASESPRAGLRSRWIVRAASFDVGDAPGQPLAFQVGGDGGGAVVADDRDGASPLVARVEEPADSLRGRRRLDRVQLGGSQGVLDSSRGFWSERAGVRQNVVRAQVGETGRVVHTPEYVSELLGG